MTIYLPAEMRKRLEELSRKTGDSISRVIQKALEDFFLYEERKNKMREFLDRWTGEKDAGLIEVWMPIKRRKEKRRGFSMRVGLDRGFLPRLYEGDKRSGGCGIEFLPAGRYKGGNSWVTP